MIKMPIKETDLAVELIGITKYFPGTIANHDVYLKIKKGEVVALLGENGAGKSTLMKILYGMYQPDSGSIKVNGKDVKIRSPQDAMALGIGMIHQHFTLVPVHTVVENVLLGAGAEDKGRASVSEAVKEIERMGKAYDLEVDPFAFVRQLAVGMQQRVEILKALYRGAQTLIMDEPTAVLTPQNTERLFSFIRDFREAGHSVIFITHKLNEVLDIADRIVVLRSGNVVGELLRSEASERELAQMMVGREVADLSSEVKAQEKDVHKKESILRVENIKVKGDRGHWAVDSLSMNIDGGEIFGIAGVSGNGQEELAEALCGLRAVSEGQIILRDNSLVGKSVHDLIHEGIGYIPADRHREGLVLDMSVEENLILKRFSSSEFASRGVLSEKNIQLYAQKIIEDYAIKTPSSATKAKALSGGNQQKIVIARELGIASSLLVAVQPTRGLDLGAADYVHRALLNVRNEGQAVLLISTELSEVLTLSDRIGVMYRGRILKVFRREEADIEEIGLLMVGVTHDET